MSEVAIDGLPDEPLLPMSVGRCVTACLSVVAVLGLLGGVLWHFLTVPPTYTIGDDRGAIITERALAQVFTMDIWYLGVSVVLGLVLGVIWWWLFRGLGWPGVLLAMVAGVVAGVICWQFGRLLGPNGFVERISEASPGDRVPMDQTLHAPLLVLVWPAAVGVPILVASIVDLVRKRRR